MLHFNAHKMNLNGLVVGFHNLIPIYFQIKLTLLLKHERMARTICSFVEVVHITLKVPLLKGNWNTQRNSLSLRYNASCQTSDYLFNPIKTSFAYNILINSNELKRPFDPDRLYYVVETEPNIFHQDRLFLYCLF